MSFLVALLSSIHVSLLSFIASAFYFSGRSKVVAWLTAINERRSAGCTAIMRSITVGALHSSDYTFDEGQLFIWTGAEIAMTIVATSIPILRALVSDGGGTGQSGATQLRTFQVLEGKEHKAVATRGRAASVSGGSEALGA